MLNDIGVKPDVTVDLSDDDLLRGLDAQLETGIRSLAAPPARVGLLPFLFHTLRDIAA